MKIRYYIRVIDSDTEEVIFEGDYPRSEITDNHEEFMEAGYRSRENVIKQHAEYIAEEMEETSDADKWQKEYDKDHDCKMEPLGEHGCDNHESFMEADYRKREEAIKQRAELIAEDMEENEDHDCKMEPLGEHGCDHPSHGEDL